VRLQTPASRADKKALLTWSEGLFLEVLNES